jgi:hypothetical protein
VDPVPDPLLLRKSGSAGNRVRKLTIPTEQPSLVGEVSAKFMRIRSATWSA